MQFSKQSEKRYKEAKTQNVKKIAFDQKQINKQTKLTIPNLQCNRLKKSYKSVKNSSKQSCKFMKKQNIETGINGINLCDVIESNYNSTCLIDVNNARSNDGGMTTISHEKCATTQKFFVCKKCGKFFKKRINLKHHVYTVHSNKIVPCPVCCKPFSNRRYMRRHVLTTHSTKIVTCKECSRTFKNNWALRNHKSVVHSAIKVTCGLCNKSFANKLYLTRHLKRHERVGYGSNLHFSIHNDKTYPNCTSQSETRSLSKSRNRSNKKYEQKQEGWSRNDGNEIFAGVSTPIKSKFDQFNLNLHDDLNKEMPVTSNKNIPCPFFDCLEEFYSLLSLIYHVKDSHDTF